MVEGTQDLAKQPRVHTKATHVARQQLQLRRPRTVRIEGRQRHRQPYWYRLAIGGLRLDIGGYGQRELGSRKPGVGIGGVLVPVHIVCVRAGLGVERADLEHEYRIVRVDALESHEFFGELRCGFDALRFVREPECMACR